jgi:6-phosphogluconolactonase/glucosamine-6-phosphate isomerase/deaminase
MQEILASRKIVLLVSGKGKSQTTEELMSGKISTTLPATLLWLHDNVDCLIDRSGVGQS